MDSMTPNQKIAAYHFALGHVRRLRILAALGQSRSGLSFEDLAQKSAVYGSSLTHHLRILKSAGLVAGKIRGRRTFYRALQVPGVRPSLGAA